MADRFRGTTEFLVAHLKEPARAAAVQADGVKDLLGQLTATAAALTEATAVLKGASQAPKRIELIRDAQGRAAGAVVAPVAA